MKKLVILIVATIISLSNVIFTNHIVADACSVTYIEYDLDEDKSLTENDLNLMIREVIDGKSQFSSADMVKLKKLLMETEAHESVIYINTERPREEDIMIATNFAKNCELTGITYENGKFVLSDLLGQMTINIPEANSNEYYDEWISDVLLDDGTTVEIGLLNNKIRAFIKSSIGKPAVGYSINSDYAVTEEHTAFLQDLFNNGKLISVSNFEEFYFETENMDVFLYFSTKIPEDSSIIASATLGEITYQLATDGNVYCILAIA